MKYDKLISDRLGGKDFFKTSYYKFEKFNKLKKQYILENENELLDFGIGESDFMPYHEILDEFSKQIYVNGNQKYSDNGIEIFKDAARQHLKETYKLKTNDLEINHVIGAKSALCIIPIAFISENDYVITTTPGYQVLSNMSKWLKAKIYEIPLLEENNYLPDLDKIDENILSSIFTPYEKGLNGMFGLGLSIVKKSLQLLNYDIKATNVKNGVNFIIK